MYLNYQGMSGSLEMSVRGWGEETEGAIERAVERAWGDSGELKLKGSQKRLCQWNI